MNLCESLMAMGGKQKWGEESVFVLGKIFFLKPTISIVTKDGGVHESKR